VTVFCRNHRPAARLALADGTNGGRKRPAVCLIERLLVSRSAAGVRLFFMAASHRSRRWLDSLPLMGEHLDRLHRFPCRLRLCGLMIGRAFKNCRCRQHGRLLFNAVNTATRSSCCLFAPGAPVRVGVGSNRHRLQSLIEAVGMLATLWLVPRASAAMSSRQARIAFISKSLTAAPIRTDQLAFVSVPVTPFRPSIVRHKNIANQARAEYGLLTDSLPPRLSMAGDSSIQTSESPYGKRTPLT